MLLVWVGFVGLGRMGLPMARNLLRSGYSLAVYNRSREPVKALAKEGAYAAGSPREVAERAEVVLLSLPGPSEVLQVLFGERGLAEGLAEGKMVIDTSTTDPATAKEAYARFREMGVGFLDAPVSGGPEGAERATLTFMVGGEREVFERSREILNRLGKNIFYVGPPGSGQAVKLVNQILVGLHTIATAEACLFAETLGLDHEKVYEIIKTSAGDSFIFRRAYMQMARRLFTEGWQTYLIQKDLGLVLRTAEGSSLPMPATALARQLYSSASRAGYEKKDSATLVEVLRRLAGR